MQYISFTVICWIAIYLLDSIIHSLNNWVLSDMFVGPTFPLSKSSSTAPYPKYMAHLLKFNTNVGHKSIFANLDGKFPIDTASVIKEHHFLDQDSIQSLYR